MNIMKKLLLIIPIILMMLIVSCSTTKHVSEEIYGVNVSNVLTLSTDTFTIIQLDSMTVTDKLPNYEKWVKTYLKDGSTNIAYQYSTLYDPETGIVYTVKFLRDGSDRCIVMKRLTTSEK